MSDSKLADTETKMIISITEVSVSGGVEPELENTGAIADK